MEGFEPSTSSVSAMYSNQLSYIPIMVGQVGIEPTPLDFQSNAMTSSATAPNSTPGRIRTSNQLVRSQVLYPVELRVHLWG